MFRRLPSLLLMTILFIGVTQMASAQNRDRERPAPQTFKDRLWYGGGFGLGFVGGNQTSQFNMGISPMVGYKIIPWFSVGPRLGIDYTYYKAPSTLGRVASTNIFSFYTGVFARAKIFRGIFAQGEYGVTFGKLPYLDGFGRLVVDNNNKVVKDQVTQESGLVGLGYNSGGLFATELVLLYDVLVPEDSYQNPWNFRFGFTYRF